ncbi:MAG: TfoX/Sxy family protein [Rhodospirillaceae bacterium]|jgi:DNA transformation protein and related proteins|nr:TfoX/Sxy family protein [Rhodospirillaceae bacterium]MBT6116382.1 TfoX/Sxy family protein [Rhodospirillaceae bacterium]
MAKTSPALDRALGLLLPLGDVRSRAMFGGWGLYLDGVMFALIAYETLYLKVDAETKQAFAAAGGQPFEYEREGRKPVEMSYWTLPDEHMADPGTPLPWAERAVAAARRNAAKKRKRAKSRS